VKYTKENLSKQYGHLFFICFVVTFSSCKRGLFLCDCGKLTTKRLSHVLTGATTSCGRCNEISADDMMGMEFGHLMQKVPKDTLPGSNEKDYFTCDCGREIYVQICKVFNGHITNCSRCNEISADDMMGMEFGHLMQKVPKATPPGSNKKDDFICDCGRTSRKTVQKVFSGHTTSCGDCGLIVKQWYQKNEREIRKAKTPIEPGYFHDCPIIFLDVMTNTKAPVPAICPVCKKEYYPRWENIRLGGSLTCVCVHDRVSRQAVEISSFVQSLGFETEFEYKVGKMSFDIFVIGKNLLIEYDGSHWHKTDEKKLKDADKHLKAIKLGFKCLRIQESEWKKENRENVKKQLASLLGVNHDLLTC
jgi:very-short-patch-repair endonuclease